MLPFATSRVGLNEEEEIFIPISEDEYKSIAQPTWETTIICKVMGRSFSKEFLRKELEKMWKCTGKLEMTTMGKGFYIIQCPTQDKRSSILMAGPWSILGSHIWVQCWEPGLKPSMAQISEVPRWVALPELPIEFFNR